MSRERDGNWVPALVRGFKNKENFIHSSSCNQQNQLFPNFCISCLKLECKFCHKEGDYPHKDHQVLPLYKASHEDCFHVNQVSELIDISDIHTFLINRKQIVFVNRRPRKSLKSTNKVRGGGYRCEICGKEFQNDKRFCSIECKNDSGESFLVKEKSQVPQPNPHSYRTKKRKGIPRRAPFF